MRISENDLKKKSFTWFMLPLKDCGYGLRMGFQGHVTRCIGKGVGEAKGIHGGGLKK